MKKMEIKDLNMTIYELIPCMTLAQMSMVYDKQKKDVTL